MAWRLESWAGGNQGCGRLRSSSCPGTQPGEGSQVTGWRCRKSTPEIRQALGDWARLGGGFGFQEQFSCCLLNTDWQEIQGSSQPGGFRGSTAAPQARSSLCPWTRSLAAQALSAFICVVHWSLLTSAGRPQCPASAKHSAPGACKFFLTAGWLGRGSECVCDGCD